MDQPVVIGGVQEFEEQFGAIDPVDMLAWLDKIEADRDAGPLPISQHQ